MTENSEEDNGTEDLSAIDTLLNAVQAIKSEFFQREQEIDGVKVYVTAKSGVFPDTASLLVSRISEEDQESIDSIIEQERDNNHRVAASYSYDIKIVDTYTIQELAGVDEKIVYDPQLYNVVVSVEDSDEHDDTMKIEKQYIKLGSEEDEKVAAIEFMNVRTYDIAVGKTVTGNMGDKFKKEKNIPKEHLTNSKNISILNPSS